MNYHPEDFLNLSLVIKDDGGDVLPDPCRGETFRIRLPDPRGQLRWTDKTTTHCNKHARAAIPYDQTLHVRIRDDEGVLVVEHKGEKPHGKFATVCLVDDAVGLWPRYANAVTDRSYQAP